MRELRAVLPCKVRIREASLMHEVEVFATSVMEAAALGYRELCKDGWTAKVAEDAVAIEVTVQQPAPPDLARQFARVDERDSRTKGRAREA